MTFVEPKPAWRVYVTCTDGAISRAFASTRIGRTFDLKQDGYVRDVHTEGEAQAVANAVRVWSDWAHRPVNVIVVWLENHGVLQ